MPPPRDSRPRLLISANTVQLVPECPYPPSPVILTTGQACVFHSMTISAGPARVLSTQAAESDQLPTFKKHASSSHSQGSVTCQRLQHVSSISHPNPGTILHIREAPGHRQAVLLTCKSVPGAFGCCRFPRATSLPRRQMKWSFCIWIHNRPPEQPAGPAGPPASAHPLLFASVCGLVAKSCSDSTIPCSVLWDFSSKTGRGCHFLLHPFFRHTLIPSLIQPVGV